MIWRCLVERLLLESLSKTLVVQTFRATSALETEFVVVEMLHADGSITLLRAYVVEEITTMSAVDVPDDLRSGFNKDTPWPETRVSGDIDILIGMEELALHPTQLDIQDNLGIFVSPLSSTTVLGGRHERIHPAVTTLSQACLMLRSASSPSLQKSFKQISKLESLFQLGEDMGNYIPKSCSNCRKCTTCTFAGSSITQKERIQLEYIERGISHDREEKVFRVKYPFLEDPREALTDNRKQAVAYALSLENKLQKQNLKSGFDEEFQKFIDSKSLRESLEEEQKNWSGPVHYVPLQLVVNPDSQSTPLRIVTNTSCKDPVAKL